MEKFLNANRVLCLSPHPDDIEYGALGIMYKFKDTQFDILTISIGGKFDLGPVTGSSGVVGEYFGEGENGLYTAYTINEMTYYDYKDGTTIFIVESSGITSDWLVSSAITKNEALLNIIDAPELQSNVFIERGKISGLESVERLGEVDNIGDLVRYGYKFFKILTTNNT